MFDFRIGSLAALLSISFMAVSSNADDAPTETAADRWTSTGWPLLQRFCLDCHNQDIAEAELDLSQLETLQGISSGGGSMQRVLEMVRFGAMPPEDAELPSDEERKILVNSLDQTLFSVSCDSRPRPGKVTARRLNRAEYNHTIRDLFGTDLNPADAFPSDEVGAGFDNNADVLSLSPLLLEKYLAAAEEVASIVLIDPATLPKLDEARPSDQLLVDGDVKTGKFGGRFLSDEAFVWANFRVAVPGEYRVDIFGGASHRQSQPVWYAVYNRDGLLVGKFDLKFYGGNGASQRADFKLDLEPGDHRILIQPIRAGGELVVGETRDERFIHLDDTTVAKAVQRSKSPLKPDHRFDHRKYPSMIRKIRLAGPRKPPQSAFPPSQWKIIRKQASLKGDKWTGVKAAATQSLMPLMRRAFRQPVSEAEVAPYVQLVIDATTRGESYYRGMQIAVSAILVSPRFLFRIETPPETAFEARSVVAELDVIPLTQHQLATRLSYFLWSSMPDDRLLAAADKGELTAQRLPQQVRRMLDDEKSAALASQFAAQWLGLRNLEPHQADTDRFPMFTDSLKTAMVQETESLFLNLVRNNRPAAELLTADYTFVNAELATHYGLSGVEGTESRQVSLTETNRRGVLSHASVLTLTSNPGRTSPVKRGKWILENILGTPPPDPPAGVPELEQTETFKANATLREQLEIHRADPACAACHRVMDQLGFGLEQFDAVGRYRGEQASNQRDASGELPGGRVFNGAKQLSEVLGSTEKEAFARTITERLITFSLGRELTPADRCTVEAIVDSTSKGQYRLVDLIVEVVQSQPFQSYQWIGPQPTTDAETH